MGLDRPLYKFIAIMGLVSLFADWLYEGARAALPQYMYSLGASALVVGTVFGVGDALGYGLRFLTGPLADRRGGYWGETLAGYTLQLAAVIGLAVAPWLPAAVGMVVLERFSKALRTPARDAIISAAGGRRQGVAFGIHAALDQIGAVLGAATSLALLLAGFAYGSLFLALAAPGAAALAALYLAYSRFEVRPRGSGRRWGRVDKRLALFATSQFFLGSALVHISLDMYTLARDPWQGSLVYLTAMAADSLLSLAWGVAHELTRRTIYLAPFAALAASLAFSSRGLLPGLAGALAYSAATSFEDVAVKALAAEMSEDKATALGVVNSAFGLGLVIGGVLYGASVDRGLYWAMPIFSALFAAASAASAHFSVRPT